MLNICWSTWKNLKRDHNSSVKYLFNIRNLKLTKLIKVYNYF